MLLLPEITRSHHFFMRVLCTNNKKGKKLKVWLLVGCIKPPKPTFSKGTFAKSLNHCLLDALGHGLAWVETQKGHMPKNTLREFSSQLVQEKSSCCPNAFKTWNNAHRPSSPWEGASYPLLLQVKPTRSRRCPPECSALGQVTWGWRDQKGSWCHTVNKNPATKVLQQSTRKPVQHKEARRVRKHKQKMRLDTCLNGHVKLSALKILEADCTVVELLPNG